ncbi:dimethyladenosine transferase 2, mitochondrial [Anabrus simplex]|uniref:dimethyladenosine transferase 2, mitochondrial n=1 Tax=Anabrus simplex TaxID=316456 RepID=UPI0035A2EBA0
MRPGLLTRARNILRIYSRVKDSFGNSQLTNGRMAIETDCFSPAFITKVFSSSALSQNDVLEDGKNKEFISQKGQRKGINKSENNNSVLSKEMREYLSSKESLSRVSDIMPHSFLKRRKKSGESLYVVDDDVAKQFVDAVKSVWNLEEDHVVLEGNPGLGLISNELINGGVKRLLLYESCNTFHPQLQKLQEQYPGIVEITHKDIFSIWKLAFLDKMDHGSRVAEILDQLPERKWTEEPAVKVVGALPTLSFVRHLILSIIFQTGIMMHGRPELYLALPPYLFIHLTCERDAGYLLYRSTTVLFQLFFKTELLAKLPRKAYLPWDAETFPNKNNRFKKVKDIDPEYLYVVKIVPRRDLYDTVVPVEKLQPLWYFVRHHFLKRRNRVIPDLERWIPGCGSRLVLQGMNIFTQFGDLTPEEVLSLFHEFSSWPEYPHSPFLASMETMFLKMEQSAEDVEKDIAESDIDNLQSSNAEEDAESATSNCILPERM